MKALPENIIIQKNKLATASAWLVLLDITLNDDAGTTLYLVRNTEDVIRPILADGFEFTNAISGWNEVTNNVTLTAQANSLKVESTGSDPYFANSSLNLNGATHHHIQIRLKRLSGTGWDGKVYYRTAGHTYSSSYYKAITQPSNFSEYQIIDIDMSDLTLGGTDYIDNTITGLRLDLGSGNGDDFEIDYIHFMRTYSKFNFDLKAASTDSKGTIPILELSVSNITHILQLYLLQLSGAIGSTVKITVVNSAYLYENYTELEVTYNVIGTETTQSNVIFRLGAPNPMVQRFPLQRFIGLHCGWTYRTKECGYLFKTIAGITLSTPVSIQVNSHGFSTDDNIELETCNGITGGLEGSYIITKTDDNNFTLNSTVGTNYGGSYTSGGKAGYSVCNRTLADCRIRGQQTMFGGFPAMRNRSIRIV